MRLYLSPIKGITDSILRNKLQEYFGGIDDSIAPFFLNINETGFHSKNMSDIFLENNKNLSVIPQIISNSPKHVAAVCQELKNCKQSRINLNFGCPFPIVANKKRGSALMKNPEIIRDIIEEISELNMEVSLKIRLGYDNINQSFQLLEKIADLPISKVFVHARLGIDKYAGDPDLETFIKLQNFTNYKLIYNGDIKTREDFLRIKTVLNNPEELLIGRGGVSNPFLFSEIKNNKLNLDEKNMLFCEFNRELYEAYKIRLGNSAVIRMKALWHYFKDLFPDDLEYFRKIIHSKTTDEMDRIFRDLPIIN